jgi:hypothetical protein
MQPRNFRTYLAAASLILVAGCQHFPPVAVELSDPEVGGFHVAMPQGRECVLPFQKGTDQEGNESCFLAYKDSKGHVCFSPDDAQALITFCKQQKK